MFIFIMTQFKSSKQKGESVERKRGELKSKSIKTKDARCKVLLKQSESGVLYS